MRKPLKMLRRRGGTMILVIGVLLAIVAFAIFGLEMQTMFNYQYAIEVRAQRGVNSIVETCINNYYRADGYNVMTLEAYTWRGKRIAGAEECWWEIMNDNLNINQNATRDGGKCVDANGKILYTVTYSNPKFGDGRDVYIDIDGTSTNVTAQDKVVHPIFSVDVTFRIYSGLAKGSPIDVTNTYVATNFITDETYRRGS